MHIIVGSHGAKKTAFARSHGWTVYGGEGENNHISSTEIKSKEFIDLVYTGRHTHPDTYDKTCIIVHQLDMVPKNLWTNCILWMRDHHNEWYGYDPRRPIINMDRLYPEIKLT